MAVGAAAQLNGRKLGENVEFRKLDSALARVEKYGGIYDPTDVVAIVKALPGVVGGAGLLHYLQHAASDEEFDDHLAEALYVAVFKECGWRVEMYPFGNEGPDLQLRSGDETAYVEVTRFRPKYPGPQPLADESDDNGLAGYGNISRDRRKAINKIFHKYRQATRPSSLIAVWNDDGDMEEIEVGLAVQDRIDEGSVPIGLEAVIYGSRWRGAQQFYSFSTGTKPSPFTQRILDALMQVKLSSAIANFVREVV